MELIEDGYIPNNNQGQPILSIEEGDTFIAGTPFLNATPCMVRKFTIGDTDPQYTIFDKRRTDVYPQAVRDDVWFDVLDPGLFKCPEELNQAWNYDNFLVPYKYRWWIKLVDDQYKDSILYDAALSGDALDEAVNYVKVPE